MQLIALGQAVAVLPASIRRHAWADVVCVPVLDAPRSTILLAWPERTRSRAVAAVVRASTDVAAEVPVAQIPGGSAAHFGGAGGWYVANRSSSTAGSASVISSCR
jgi:hypothetical protein